MLRQQDSEYAKIPLEIPLSQSNVTAKKTCPLSKHNLFITFSISISISWWQWWQWPGGRAVTALARNFAQGATDKHFRDKLWTKLRKIMRFTTVLKQVYFVVFWYNLANVHDEGDLWKQRCISLLLGRHFSLSNSVNNAIFALSNSSCLCPFRICAL